MFYFDEELQEWVDDESGEVEVPLPPREELKYRNEPPSPPGFGLGGKYVMGKLPNDYVPAERPRDGGLRMPSMLDEPRDYEAGIDPSAPARHTFATGYGDRIISKEAPYSREAFDTHYRDIPGDWKLAGGGAAPQAYVDDVLNTMDARDRGEMSETQLKEKIKANEYGGVLPKPPQEAELRTTMDVINFRKAMLPEIQKQAVEAANNDWESMSQGRDLSWKALHKDNEIAKRVTYHLNEGLKDLNRHLDKRYNTLLEQEKRAINPPSRSDEQLLQIINEHPDPKEREKAQVIYDALQKGKVELAKASGQGRATAYGDIRQITVLDTKDNNQMYTMTASDFNQKNSEEPGRYVDAAKAKSALTQTALMEDIQGAINNSRNSVKNLKNDFDETSRLLLYKAVSGQNPSGAINNFINGQFGKALSPDQIDYLTDLAQLVENAMAMRSVLGAGQGSDQLRDAIKATIPNKGTFSKEYAQSQLDKFEQQMNRLKRGVPKVKLAEPEGPIGGGTTGTQVPRKPGGWKQNANGVWYKE